MDMPYKLLDKITGGFSNEIGRGTFGVVYKGKDEAGREIAVKLLRVQRTDLDGNAFRKEFNNLTKLEHPNIVRLVGFCDDEDQKPIEHDGKKIMVSTLHKALCFEYLQNGSLEKHLSDEHQGFDWKTRYVIIKGICMGLKYLHTGLESPVLHSDLKPDNILLDDNMVPKIADFGLSRLLGEETSKTTLSVLGTLGYCPPEFLNYRIISKEFDIFSLGVIIIKVICGSAAHSPGDDKTKTRKFIRQVQKKWRERLQAIPGYTSFDVECRCNQVKKCIEIALNCTIADRQQRPTIENIIDQLAETEKHINDEANSMKESHGSRLSLPTTNLSAAFMKEITLDFATERELGASVFGTVYKGILPYGWKIAVKRLAENAPVAPGTTFDNEVANLMGLKHDNIVQLVGFSHEAQKKVIQHSGRYVTVDIIQSCLCYEYLHHGSLDKHIYDNTSINWDTRFKIIKGICQGLRFLHKELDLPLIHMNLVPNSIWLDDKYVPKIADFGLSRLFGQEQTRMYTVNVKGHNGYIAPEYLFRGEISTMSDIYSLGMIILEITTRERNYPASKDISATRQFVDIIHQNWKTDEQIMYKYPLLDPNGCQQVKACIIIGLQCVEADRKKRPSILDIIDKLNRKRVPIFDQITADTLSPEVIMLTPTSTVCPGPWQLRFPFKQNKSFSCPVRLTNTTDDYIAARLLTNNPKRYLGGATSLCGVVPPRSTYALVVTMKGHEQLLADKVLSLESCIDRNKGLNMENADHSVDIKFKNIFREAKGSGADIVHKQKLKVEFEFPKEATYDQPFQYEIEIISDREFSEATCVDVHSVEPWIMTSHHRGVILIWEYQNQELVSSFDFTRQRPVNSVRFIERKEWFVAGDEDGIIYVYSYDTDENEVTSFEAHVGGITSLAVHPTDPFVISSSNGDHLIKIWDWEKGWECIRTLEGHSETVMQVILNPVDTDSFASASLDQTIKIWNISSSECKKTLSDHLVGLPYVVTYYTGDSGQCLVIGSSDGTTQIWDLETETCLETLKGHTDCISCVYRHPELPLLLTGSQDGTVRTWNTNTYRLQDIFGIKLGAVSAFGYIKRVQRVVVACHKGIAIMEMKLS